MSLIHGSRGLIYFVHQFKPTFHEAALLEDPEMLTAVTAINRQVHSLAPVLNSPYNGPVVRSGGTLVAAVEKRHGNATWLFAVSMQNTPGQATFRLTDIPDDTVAEVLDEHRTIAVRERRLVDDFKPYEVHLYRITAASQRH